jgi:hypothetical protein
MTDDEKDAANFVISLTRYVLAQVSERGIDPTHAASAMLALAAHAPRDAMGPTHAAGFIHGLVRHDCCDMGLGFGWRCRTSRAVSHVATRPRPTSLPVAAQARRIVQRG